MGFRTHAVSCIFCHSSFWIGLYTDGSGNYYWQDKPSEVAYQQNAFWKIEEPDGGVNSQQCVTMWMRHQGRWVDDECAYPKSYICQYKITQRGK